MSLKVYNTLTREKETFEPLVPGKVKMYVCGPTVYDYIHIGNARPAILFDVVRRYLEASGYEVTYIVNFTDVDDKLIRKAEQLGSTVPEVADRFIAAFEEDIAALGVRRATRNPRVTRHIDDIVAFIKGLEDKGFAYASGGDVYFRTGKFGEYGKLSHQNLEELQFGIRIEVDERKENPEDFVLWKGAKPGEISWDSPWGPGRPGWHIECSAMARHYLGDTLDIHGGGHDLQFPHHECEVAQSEALTGKPLARYWMHNGYIHINNEKMSKSLGNGITVRELLKRTKPEAVRYFMLATHYRSPLNFSDSTIRQAENSVLRIANCNSNLHHRMAAIGAEPVTEVRKLNEPPLPSGDEALDERLREILDRFRAKMDDDFNTPDAITAVFDLVAEANQYMQRDVATASGLRALADLLLRMDDVLGLLPSPAEANGLLDEEVERLIAERAEARKAKNWARADEIRDLLAAQGIVLEDTPQGLRWRRK
ncbi:cysteinyl-tRNA synthetase [Paenibacillus sp. 32O-W]|uniref:Cysteine--tRNA ligase n=1 Tax=Paenibacillus cisolokensis TaxID=1658519 RepID=A0ABQ4N7B4_9BACL|nr:MULTISPECIES: cysteine--tRNA ligase [Paenibacillus]ALS26153.1 cysteinyl-tRNA synthetase [Paenibacillus sp. 32O-W]GIQ64097.1 cysteine--tRNA ligase [Paenibacillus cisolokensis]